MLPWGCNVICLSAQSIYRWLGGFLVRGSRVGHPPGYLTTFSKNALDVTEKRKVSHLGGEKHETCEAGAREELGGGGFGQA